MAPETELGQMLTVLYAIVGLPISMLALKTIGEVIVRCIKSLVIRIEKWLFKTRGVQRIRQKTFLGTCAMMLLFLLLGSILEVVAEGWSFTEGIYTWFVVLSTIGFGDYIPFQSLDQKSHADRRKSLWVFIAILACFTLIGLCVVSAVLTSLVQAVEEYRSKSNPYVCGSKLAQFVKRQKGRVSRSGVYAFNRGMVYMEEGQNIEHYHSRVRTRSYSI